MKSTNLHQHHQLQDQQLVNEACSSISVATPTSSYGIGDNYAWTPNNYILNTNNFNYDVSGAIPNSREKNNTRITAIHNPMIQDFDINKWTSSSSCSSCYNYQVEKIEEEELQSIFLPKFTEMSNSTASSIGEDCSLSSLNYIKNEQKDVNNDLSEKLMLKTLTSSYHMNPHDFSARELYSYDPQSLVNLQYGVMPSRGNFSQIYPSINISNLSRSTSCLDMKTQPLDLLSTARFSQGICQPSPENLCMLNEGSMPCGQMQSTSRPSCTPNNISLTNNRAGETKRLGSTSMEPKVAQSAPKKFRSETRAPCPTIKVRKEKLGDRIAALQQLVAPFGKTDTASVLMEAIGYIKFLTNQVETLSVPYMRKKTSRSLHGGSKEEEGDVDTKSDLRSRGLCLVPLSCMSYVAASEGLDGGFWPTP